MEAASVAAPRRRGRPRRNVAPPEAASTGERGAVYGCSFQDERRPSGFVASDLVWGKVRSHPWWPGMVLDPSAASELALRYRKPDALLVAYFGDKTFAWNEATVLKPFHSNLAALEKQSSAKSFVSAVASAVNEVSRRVEVALSCRCGDWRVFREWKFENAGVQEGTIAPLGDVSFIRESFEPDKLLWYLEDLACAPACGAERLEVAVLVAQLRTFNKLRGYKIPLTSLLPALDAGVTEDGAADLLDEEVENSDRVECGSEHSFEENTLTEPMEVGDASGRNSPLQVTGRKRKDMQSHYLNSASFQKRKKLDLLCNLEKKTMLSPAHQKDYYWCDVVVGVETDEIHEKATAYEGKEQKEEGYETTVLLDSYWSDLIICDGTRKQEPACPLEEHGYENMEQLQTAPIALLSETAVDFPGAVLHSSEVLNNDFKLKGDKDMVVETKQVSFEEPADESKSNEAGEMPPTGLIMYFTDPVAVPSVGNLISIFSRYGPLVEEETEVSTSDGLAQVCFRKHSDAKAALSAIDKIGDLGPALAGYRLKTVLSAPTVALQDPSWTAKDPSSLPLV